MGAQEACGSCGWLDGTLEAGPEEDVEAAAWSWSELGPAAADSAVAGAFIGEEVEAGSKEVELRCGAAGVNDHFLVDL